MKKKSVKRILSGVMVLAVSIALCACGGDKNADKDAANNSQETAEDTTEEKSEDSAAGEPTQGGSVVVGMTQDLVSLDPHAVTDAGTRNVVFNLYEGLVKATPAGELAPAVASDYTISDDAKVYTFTLRDGVTFHDGSAVTVDDIKYSIERYAEEQGDSSAFSIVDEVVTPDDKTVEVHLKEANSEFISELTLGIIPASNEDPAGTPVGTGPFKFVSYTPGQNIVLERYDGYWGTPAYLDQVTFKFVADVETAFTELQAGTLDILNYLTADQVSVLSDDFTIVDGSMNLVHALYLNNDYEPLSNPLVRQALNYAVDRASINDFLFGGASHLIGTHMLPALERYYNADTEGLYSYDPEKAKELLTEAGYADGFELSIMVPSSYSQHVSTAEIIVENLKAVGIDAKLDLVEWSTWLSECYQGRKYEATVIGVDGKLAPSDWLTKYVSTDAKNFMNYKSDKFDELFTQAKATVDDTEKANLYKEAEMVLAEDAVNVFIEDPADFVAVNSKLAGYQFYPIAAQDMSCVYYK
ncbi:ABC transporter substrate-binding protein [Oscillospiraceae bacterium NTUH-002-81]|nr:ABC transporter substrate-binding protein [Oscillospiraceae bacterium NTUH-002-81]